MIQTKTMILLAFVIPITISALCASKVKAEDVQMKNVAKNNEVVTTDDPLIRNDQTASNNLTEAKLLDDSQIDQEVKPIKVGNDLIRYPFGLSQAKVICAAMRVCSVELEAGEVIQGKPLLGDTQRWWVGYSVSGNPKTPTPHIMLKPLVNETIKTNMLVTTNKRVYQLQLESVMEGFEFTPRVGFFYPQEPEFLGDVAMIESGLSLDNATTDSILVEANQLNFNYLIKGAKKRVWHPERVFDDGKKIFIVFPSKVKFYEIPALFIVGDSGKFELVNYRVKTAQDGNVYFIVDRLFKRGVLVLTSEKREERLYIAKMED